MNEKPQLAKSSNDCASSIFEKMCKFFKDDPTLTPGSADQQAFLDFKEQIDHEAEIKKRKYFGGDDEEAYSLFDPS